MPFSYPCPACGTDNNLHEFNCEYEGTERWLIEKAYLDIIITLTDAAERSQLDDDPPGIAYETLTADVSDLCSEPDGDPGRDDGVTLAVADDDTGDATESPAPPSDSPSGWVSMHSDCLQTLKQTGHVEERAEMGGLYLLEPEEKETGIIPLFDPIKTVFEYGPIDGAKDISVYSMVSWCELQDLSWDATESFIAWWLTETNRWETEHWGESDISELCAGKQHVHSESLGWGNHPKDAKTRMERGDAERKLDAYAVDDRVSRATFE